MLSVLIRTVLIYLLLSFMLRLTGKRQLGELEVAELVTTLLLSEIAAIPINDPDIPLLFGIIPILLICASEVLLSFFKNRFPLLKRCIEGKPSLLIHRGRLRQKELGKLRISVEELLGELRLQGVADIGEVEYAILESNGKLSVFRKAEAEPPTRSELGLPLPPSPLTRPLIVDGHIDREALLRMGKSKEWLEEVLKKKGLSARRIFLLTLNDSGEIRAVSKE